MLWRMKPYSVDLRERVLAALDRGMTRSVVISTFQVSLASLKRWLAARRDSGSLAPRPATGGPSLTITPAHQHQLRSQLAAHPDASLAEHTTLWNAAHNTSLSQSTLGRAIRRLDLTRKKVFDCERTRRVGTRPLCS
jgi:transposase